MDTDTTPLNFEEYVQPRSRSHGMFVRATSAGRLRISADALRALGSPAAIALLHDRDAHQIAIRASSGGLRVSPNQEVSARAFITEYALNEHERVDMRLDGDMLVSDPL